MKKLLLLFFFLSLPVFAFSQYYTESFEPYDSITHPPDWKVVNNAGFPINEFANWCIRDTGRILPNITPYPPTGGPKLSRAYDGIKAYNVTWGAGIPLDTNSSTVSDAWLISKKFNNIPSDAFFSFYACGGSASFLDSLQILVSPTGDTALSSFTNKIQTIIWTPPVTYGEFQNYTYDFSQFAGLNIRVAFRYYMETSQMGYVVMLDYVQMFGSVGIKPINSNIPDKFALKQNFPNPFNPQTTIRFDLAKSTNVRLDVYNSLGQVVQTLQDGFKPAGYYEATFNASSLSSGIYFYKLTTDHFTETKKMMVIK